MMKGADVYKSAILGCDHAGFALKEIIKHFLQEKGLSVLDYATGFDSQNDFFQNARHICRSVLGTPGLLGFLCCGTGVGMTMAANRFPGIRGALIYDDFTAEYSRRHNDANILIFGERTMAPNDVLRRIDIFLSHDFEGGKYMQRNDSMDLLQVKDSSI